MKTLSTKPPRSTPEANEPVGSPTIVETPGEERPRYLQVARALREAIASGAYPVGAHLPTEHELCTQFGISRFTAREAVRTLVADGLVTRRPRVGTVVTAPANAPRYAHSATTIQDLLQYASDTELRLVYVGKVALDREHAFEFGSEPGEEWVYGIGLRVAGTAYDQAAGAVQAICITRLYLNPVLKGIETKLRGRRGAVQALIESDYDVKIERVEQELQGVLLDADDAANLGAEPGAAGLRIKRRYYDRSGVLLEAAENVHAADRFVYRMQIRR